MAVQKQDDQLEHTYSSYVRTRDVALKTCQRRWMRGRSGERGSGISVPAVRDDDDDDACNGCWSKGELMSYIVMDSHSWAHPYWLRSKNCVPKNRLQDCLKIPSTKTYILNIIIIMSCRQHGSPRLSFATRFYRPSLPVGPQGYILYRHRAVVYRF